MILKKFFNRLDFKVVFLLLFFFVSLISFAQDNPADFIDDVEDNPPLPINDYRYEAVLLLCVIIYYFFLIN